MVEYIEREAAEDAAGEAYLKGLNPVWAVRDVPTADVVPVVRCKDCKYAQNDYDGFSTTVGCNMLKCATGWHSFCSYGERKDGGAESA